MSLCAVYTHALGVMKIAGDLKLPGLDEGLQIKSKNKEVRKGKCLRK